MDTLGLLWVLLRLERGETEMTGVVCVPASAIEDARLAGRRASGGEPPHRAPQAHQGLAGTPAVKFNAWDWFGLAR